MEIARHWRLKKQRYNLIGEVCPHCDAKIFPPKAVCPECRNESKKPEAIVKGNVFQTREQLVEV